MALQPIDSFIRAAKQIENARQAYADLRIHGHLRPTAFGIAYQGLYLVLIKRFETFLEDSVFFYAAGGSCPPRQVNSQLKRLKLLTHEQRPASLRSLLKLDRKYLEFLPYDRTEKIATVLFDGGFPFTLIDDADRKILSRCQTVRNLIAHDSEAAKAKFLKIDIVRQSLTGKKKNVIGYLEFVVTPGRTMFTTDISELTRIALKIAG